MESDTDRTWDRLEAITKQPVGHEALQQSLLAKLGRSMWPQFEMLTRLHAPELAAEIREELWRFSHLVDASASEVKQLLARSFQQAQVKIVGGRWANFGTAPSDFYASLAPGSRYFRQMGFQWIQDAVKIGEWVTRLASTYLKTMEYPSGAISNRSMNERLQEFFDQTDAASDRKMAEQMSGFFQREHAKLQEDRPRAERIEKRLFSAEGYTSVSDDARTFYEEFIAREQSLSEFAEIETMLTELSEPEESAVMELARDAVSIRSEVRATINAEEWRNAYPAEVRVEGKMVRSGAGVARHIKAAVLNKRPAVLMPIVKTGESMLVQSAAAGDLLHWRPEFYLQWTAEGVHVYQVQPIDPEAPDIEKIPSAVRIATLTSIAPQSEIAGYHFKLNTEGSIRVISDDQTRTLTAFSAAESERGDFSAFQHPYELTSVTPSSDGPVTLPFKRADFHTGLVVSGFQDASLRNGLLFIPNPNHPKEILIFALDENNTPRTGPPLGILYTAGLVFQFAGLDFYFSRQGLFTETLTIGSQTALDFSRYQFYSAHSGVPLVSELPAVPVAPPLAPEEPLPFLEPKLQLGAKGTADTVEEALAIAAGYARDPNETGSLRVIGKTEYRFFAMSVYRSEGTIETNLLAPIKKALRTRKKKVSYDWEVKLSGQGLRFLEIRSSRSEVRSGSASPQDSGSLAIDLTEQARQHHQKFSEHLEEYKALKVKHERESGRASIAVSLVITAFVTSFFHFPWIMVEYYERHFGIVGLYGGIAALILISWLRFSSLADSFYRRMSWIETILGSEMELTPGERDEWKTSVEARYHGSRDDDERAAEDNASLNPSRKEQPLSKGGRFFESEGDYAALDSKTIEDLEIFGGWNSKNTLFEKMNRTRTQIGKDRFQWLMTHPLLDAGKIRQRQEAIHELMHHENKRKEVREALSTLYHLDQGLAKSLETAELVPPFVKAHWLVPVVSLAYAAGFVVPILLTVLGWLWWPFTISACMTVVAIRFFSNRSMLPYWQAYDIQARLNHVGSFVQTAEPLLRDSNSVLLKKIAAIFSDALNAEKSPELHHLFLRGDALSAEKLYQNNRAALQSILGAIAELDTLYSQAQEAIDNLGYHGFPEMVDSPTPVYQVDLGDVHHPFIPLDESVSNSVDLHSGHSFMILTGPNEDGKSTLIKTLASNQLFAQIGSPIRGKNGRMSPARLAVRIHAKDDLGKGQSLYRMEAEQTILGMVNLAEDNRPIALYFDEMLRGTNPAEKLATIQGVIEHLASKAHVLGILATHELEVTKLEGPVPNVFNMHMTEGLDESGRRVRPFKLQPGPALTTNAIKILEQIGLPTRLLNLIKSRLPRKPDSNRSEVRKSGSVPRLAASGQKKVKHQPGSLISGLKRNRVEIVAAVARQMTARIVRIADLTPEILSLIFPAVLKQPEAKLSAAEHEWILRFYTALFRQGSSIVMPAELLLQASPEAQRDYLKLIIDALKAAAGDSFSPLRGGRDKDAHSTDGADSSLRRRAPLIHIAGNRSGELKNLFFAQENWRKNPALGVDVSRAVKFWTESEEIVASQLEQKQIRFAVAVTKPTALKSRTVLVDPAKIRKLKRADGVLFQARLTQLLLAASELSEEEFVQLARELDPAYQSGQAMVLTPSMLLSDIFAERMNAIATAMSA